MFVDNAIASNAREYRTIGSIVCKAEVYAIYLPKYKQNIQTEYNITTVATCNV